MIENKHHLGLDHGDLCCTSNSSARLLLPSSADITLDSSFCSDTVSKVHQMQEMLGSDPGHSGHLRRLLV